MKSSTFINTFKTRALALSRFVRLIAKFMLAKIENESENVNSAGKELELSLPSPPTSQSVSESSMDVKLRKRAMDKHKKTGNPHEDKQKNRHKTKKSSSSFSSLLNLLSSPAIFEVDCVMIRYASSFSPCSEQDAKSAKRKACGS